MTLRPIVLPLQILLTACAHVSPEAPKAPLATTLAVFDRANALYDAQQWPQCESAAAQAAEAGPWRRDALYLKASCAARAGHPEESLKGLEAAEILGFRDSALMAQDNDLQPVRLLPGFAALLAKVDARAQKHSRTTHRELRQMMEADQVDRREPIDWAAVSPRDAARLTRTKVLIETESASFNQEDCLNVALLLQHSDKPGDYEQATEFAKRAAALDPYDLRAVWLIAASEDRALVHRGQPQRYGTQFSKAGDKWELSPVAPGVSDDERAAHNVHPLAVLRKEAATMNASAGTKP